MPMITAPTCNINIFMAGDITEAKNICRKFCFAIGLCVTVTPTSYIYTGGTEEGFCVGLINYPRFPKPEDDLLNTAERLSHLLMEGLYQNSYTIVTSTNTLWFSRRKEQ